MKVLILILSFLLSFFSGGKTAVAGQCEGRSSSVIVEADGQGKQDKTPNYLTQAILPVQSARFSGEDTSVTPTVRSTNSGRKSQLSQKFPFRVIKSGKIIDRNNSYFFQAELLQFPSGIHSTSRYIHSICHLLI